MTPADIAQRLHARRVGDGRWVARCPAHPDSTPSLSLRAGRDGRTLIYCHAGCPADAVLAAGGLAWIDVMGAAAQHGRRQRQRSNQPREPQTAEEVLAAWAREHVGGVQ